MCVWTEGGVTFNRHTHVCLCVRGNERDGERGETGDVG